MKNQIRGSVKINAKGKHLYRFINRIHSERIYCFEQYVKGGVFCAEIYRHDLKKICSLAEEYGIEIKSFEYNTFSSYVISRRRRVGFLIGLIAVVFFSLYFSGVIVTIEIQGNEKVSDTSILAALEEIGIGTGTPFRDINYVWSENELQLMVNGISWVGMHRTGHRLVVEVTEIVEKPEMLNERMPCNIIASHSGYITYTTVLDGQLMKKVGDYVLEGDMLVTGVTSDSTGHTTLHHAIADITGRYKESIDFEEDFTKERFTETGRTERRYALRLLSLDIPLNFGKNDYKYKDCAETEKPLTVFGKVLPVSLKKYTYTEYSRDAVTLSEEELAASLTEKIYLYEQNFLSDSEIIKREIVRESGGGKLRFTVNYEIEGNICKEMEIMAK